MGNLIKLFYDSVFKIIQNKKLKIQGTRILAEIFKDKWTFRNKSQKDAE